MTALCGLVERGRAESGQFVPHVGECHGGVGASILSVLRDPGKATNLTGVLSTGNPCPISKRQRERMAEVGSSAADLCPWNDYPRAHHSAVDRDLSVEHIARTHCSKTLLEHFSRGAVVLREVIDLMQDLRVLLLQGE